MVTRNHMVSVLRLGGVDIDGKAPEDIQREITSDALRKAARGTFPKFVLVLDHTKDLLKEARSYARVKRADFALLFYATFIEHWANGEIVRLSQKRGLSAKDITALLRETQLRGKCTWVLALLGAAPLNARYVQRIAAVAEYRNAYVHYKWQPLPEGSKANEEKARVADLLRDAEATARYLIRVENRAVFRGRKRKLLLSVPAFAKVVLARFNQLSAGTAQKDAKN